MSASRNRVRRVRTPTQIRLPSVRVPTLTNQPRNPPGWNTTEISIRSRGLPGITNTLRQREPAGDPPTDWNGTRPEWSVWWGLIRNGLKPNEDFIFQSLLAGVQTSYYSTIDFLVPDYQVGIEVQGTFWHYGQGNKQLSHDLVRLALYAEQNIHIVFIDEKDALEDPEYFVEQALLRVDHSSVATGF